MTKQGPLNSISAFEPSSFFRHSGIRHSSFSPRVAEKFRGKNQMKCDLTGKVSLVTGAARGIGQAIADRLAANGSRVVYTDLDPDATTQAARRFPGTKGMRMDVTRSEEIEAVIGQVVAEFGRLDILVNNAGVNTMAHRVTIDQFPREEWDRLLAVDLTGVYEVSRCAARVMRAQGTGRIINIASIAGLVPLRLQCAFVAAKAGVVNLTKAMALELGPHGILVNGIAPGSTLTEGTKQLFYAEGGKFREQVQRMLDHVPLGRPGTVDEIAVAALFLADPENSYMNGHILTVDGGWTAGYTRDF
jgi:3-oxoacyl-[acyl-carrier protein] reductase